MYPSESSTTSSLFHFPSPSPNYLHYEEDPVFLQQFHDLFASPNIENNMPQTNNNTTDDSNTSSTIVDTVLKQGGSDQSTKTTTTTTTTKRNHNTPKKRSSKKDRHSKINTAHGPRDRRMRLSLDVARKFFGLQDMLCFDKASKTVEWLLTKSKSAIKDLTRGGGLNSNHSSSMGGANSASSTCECEVEVLSGIEEPGGTVDENDHTRTKGKGSGAKDKEKKSKGARRIAFDPITRESREKARERARERTRKRKLQGELNFSQLGCYSPAGDESGIQNHSFEVQVVEVEEPSSRERQQLHQGSSTTTTTRDHDMNFGDSLFWSPSTSFNYQHNSSTSHEYHQFAEFQVYGAFNN